VFWKHPSSSPMPFGELAWDHARDQLAAEGKASTERDIAEAAQALLRRTHQGPEAKPSGRSRKPSARDRRVAARTKATAEPAWPRPETPVNEEASEDAIGGAEASQAESGEKLADVVPLSVFDAREEATRWW
jgi:putative transposase